MKQILFLVVTTVLAVGCAAPTPVVVTSISVGSSYVAAETALKQSGARVAALAMSPPQREDGSLLGLECFEIDDTTALSIAFEPGLDGKIVQMSVCKDMREMRAMRAWRPVEHYLLPPDARAAPR